MPSDFYVWLSISVEGCSKLLPNAWLEERPFVLNSQIANSNNMIQRQSMEDGIYVQSYKFVGNELSIN